ncbi:MAG: hypothetical protein AAGB93_22875 [Planctomycetota bacterium]
MQIHPRTFLLTAVALLAPAAAQTDDFDSGTNPNGWSFNVIPPDVLEPTGGNPGGWLRNPLVDSFAPILTTGAGNTSPFTGDYRASGVTRISIDARTDGAAFGAGGREFSLLLRDTKGTAMVDDDDYVYFVGPLVPQVGQGWSSYSFDIPSQSNDILPAGWTGGWSGDTENLRPGVTWTDIISSVDAVEFWWLNPSFFAIFQQWDVGVDNISIETGGLGTAYCSRATQNSTGMPASIAATGSDAVTDNALTLAVTSLPPHTFGYFLNSRTQGSVTPPGAQGPLCLGGSIGRFDAQIWNSGASGEAMLTLDLTALPTPTGAVAAQAGETWNFQAWFRDANPMVVSNLSDAVSVTLR